MSLASPLRVSAVLPLLPPVALFGLWLTVTANGWMPPEILPAPAPVWQTGLELAGSDLGHHVAVSLGRLATGLGVGAIVGIALGLAIGLSRTVEAVVRPTLLVFLQIPTLAFVPLAILALGLGDGLRLAVMLKAVAGPVALEVARGVRDGDSRLAEVADVVGLSPLQRLRLLVLPGALPALFTGLRLAVAHGWASLLAVELLASSEGLGFVMVFGRQLFQLDVVLSGVVVIGAIGLALDAALIVLERRLILWPAPALTRKDNRQSGLLAFALPALLLLGWRLSVGHISEILLAPPAAVAQALVERLGDGSMAVWGC